VDGMAIFKEMYALRHSAIAHSGFYRLDRETALWLLTADALNALRMDADHYLTYHGYSEARTILGLPFRVTYNDPPGTPAVRLLMEPKFETRQITPQPAL
jgi:hypothetical protein